MTADSYGVQLVTISHPWGTKDLWFTLSSARWFTKTPNSPDVCSGSPQVVEGASSIANAMEMINPLMLAVIFWVNGGL
jgi:hypothetical protein